MTSQSEGFTVVSTFSGCGGSSLGYKQAGGDVRLAVEWDAHAVECYRLNFPSTTIFHGDIGKLSVERALELSELEPGELDIFDGSPPCQGFSTAGKREFADKRNRLFEEYVRLLRGFKPRAFVMENVSGMVKGKMRLVFVECLKELKASGYRVSARLLNAAYFGVPQSRKRLIFIGVREDLDIDPSHPRPTSEPTALRDVFPHMRASRSMKINPWIKGSKPAATICKTDSDYQVLSDVPGGERDLIGVKSTSRIFKFKLFGSSRPAPALTKNDHEYLGQIDATRCRPLTVEEVKLIQGFPDDFTLLGSRAKRWARIGNSVPPPLMRAVANHVHDKVLNEAASA